MHKQTRIWARLRSIGCSSGLESASGTSAGVDAATGVDTTEAVLASVEAVVAADARAFSPAAKISSRDLSYRALVVLRYSYPSRNVRCVKG